jgi:hypothetical protein
MITAASAVYIAHVVAGEPAKDDLSLYPHTRKTGLVRDAGTPRASAGRRIFAAAFGRRPRLRVKNA